MTWLGTLKAATAGHNVSRNSSSSEGRDLDLSWPRRLWARRSDNHRETPRTSRSFSSVTGVAVDLPERYRVGITTSLANACQFSVSEDSAGRILIAPSEGAGTKRNYFEAHKLADAHTDLANDGTWAALSARPPYDTPSFPLPNDFEDRLAALEGRGDLPSLVERLNVQAALADTEGLLALLRAEMPALFNRYPQGSLWFISVDDVLIKRLASMRVLLQLRLTPDVPVGSEHGVRYFGAHQLARGVMFADAVAPILLAFSPVTYGFTIGAAPHALVFLFGEFEDLRIREPQPLANAFIPGVHKHPSMLGVKVPVGSLATAHLEALLAWWTTRLNIIYSYAADPTRFRSPGSEYDVAAQAGWHYTFERLLADLQVVAAAVNAPGLLRLQGAFDALDKASGLLDPGDESRMFRQLLSRSTTVPRIKRAFQEMPLQVQARFSQWAESAFDRFYDDVLSGTMPSRRTGSGVRVGFASPTDLHDMSLDDYVATLVREARNASHGLLDILAEPRRPPKPGRPQRRLILATNQGEIPASFYEVMRSIVLGVLADAEALCDRTW
jgi:hypothetical protein